MVVVFLFSHSFSTISLSRLPNSLALAFHQVPLSFHPHLSTSSNCQNDGFPQHSRRHTILLALHDRYARRLALIGPTPSKYDPFPNKIPHSRHSRCVTCSSALNMSFFLLDLVGPFKEQNEFAFDTGLSSIIIVTRPFSDGFSFSISSSFRLERWCVSTLFIANGLSRVDVLRPQKENQYVSLSVFGKKKRYRHHHPHGWLHYS